MKKMIIGIAVLGVAVLAFGGVGYVYAQSQTPPQPVYPHRHGMMGGYGGFGHTMLGSEYDWMGNHDHGGPMHEAMIAALAQALGLSPDEIEARHEAGDTHYDIAAAEGLSPVEINELMDSVHDTVLEEAVASGWLTAEQAEWMGEHMDGMWSGEGRNNGYGGHCYGGGWFDNNPGRRDMGW